VHGTVGFAPREWILWSTHRFFLILLIHRDNSTRMEDMADFRAKRGPYGNERVNPHEPNERKYWCQKFTCTDVQLMHAVRAVGTSADAVRSFLKGKKVSPESQRT
jgi:hypothetical protein